MVEIVPAILTADKDDLKKKLALAATFSRKVQLDVADGLFVPNKTLLPGDFWQFEEDLEFEIHLMVKDPAGLMADLEKNLKFNRGKHTVIFHAEAVADAVPILESIKKSGFRSGLALNPPTPAGNLEGALYLADMILFLSVTPGFQGGGFVETVLKKAGYFKERYPQKFIGLDGGISRENIQIALSSGADELVIGSAIWQAENPSEEYNKLRELAGIIS